MNILPLSGASIQQTQTIRAAETVPSTKQAEQRACSSLPDCDKYTPEDKTGLEHSGLYRLASGKNGPELRFDAPVDESPAASEASGVPDRAAPKKSSGRKTEQCTTDTGRVDRELEKLRARQEKLAGQLCTATPDKTENLKKQLAQVENELRQKDNDSYRKAHAAVS